jgi:hypothetical protein
MEPSGLGVGRRPPRGEDARETSRDAPEELSAVHRSAAMLNDSSVFRRRHRPLHRGVLLLGRWYVMLRRDRKDYFILANTTSKLRPSTAW